MARGRHQRGWLRKERRADGKTWMLFFRITRESDGERVEHKVPVGLVRNFPSKASAWAEVDRQHLHSQINQPDFRGRITFADLAQHYEQHELGGQAEMVDPKARSPANTKRSSYRPSRRLPFCWRCRSRNGR